MNNIQNAGVKIYEGKIEVKSIVKDIETLELGIDIKSDKFDEIKSLKFKIQEFNKQEDVFKCAISKEILDLYDYIRMKKSKIEALGVLLESASTEIKVVEKQIAELKSGEK